MRSTRPTPISQSENNIQVRISQSENSTAVSGADMTAVTEKRTELHSEAIILCQTWGIISRTPNC